MNLRWYQQEVQDYVMDEEEPIEVLSVQGRQTGKSFEIADTALKLIKNKIPLHNGTLFGKLKRFIQRKALDRVPEILIVSADMDKVKCIYDTTLHIVQDKNLTVEAKKYPHFSIDTIDFKPASFFNNLPRQKYDYVFIDEVDYITLNTIDFLIQRVSRGNYALFGTPKIKDGNIPKIIKKYPNIKVFHFSAFENPNYTTEKNEISKKYLNPAQYKSEIMAEYE